MDVAKLSEITGLEIYPASIVTQGGAAYAMGKKGADKFVVLVGDGEIIGDKKGELDGRAVIVGLADHANAVAVRKALPWTKPQTGGLKISAGLGDRLGLATPGHIQAARGRGVVPFLAQQSIREMTRTNRTPDQVMDCATWGVLQEGYTDGFGSDGDHLQKFEDIDVTVAAGFTMFTIDPGLHVNDDADKHDIDTLKEEYKSVDFATLKSSPEALKADWAERAFNLEGGVKVSFDEESFLRAAVKYGNAIAHTVKMYQHLSKVCKHDFELEVSVDETYSPTTTGEHFFFASMLKKLGVKWVSMAPRFVGEFEKGVDYIGDLDVFRASLEEHVAVMKTVGPYKISIHSGSDKFSIYPIVAELTGGLMHLKTAGTSYLEALRAISNVNPELFREILDFARGRYETDRATYHVSAQLAKVPAASDLTDAQLPGLLDDFDAREVLHVTFGSVLTADNGQRFKPRFYQTLQSNEDVHYRTLCKHMTRHIEPMRK